MVETLALPAVILVTLTSFALLVLKGWQSTIGLLAVQYVGVFFLVFESWPLQMAISTLVAGWIACMVLGMAALNWLGKEIMEDHLPSNENDSLSSMPPLFYIFSAIFVFLLVLSQFSKLPSYFTDMSSLQAWGLLILINWGLLKLVFFSNPFQGIIGLLTVLSGFTILYSNLDASILAAGLFAVFSLGLSIIGAYLLSSETMLEAE